MSTYTLTIYPSSATIFISAEDENQASEAHFLDRDNYYLDDDREFSDLSSDEQIEIVQRELQDRFSDTQIKDELYEIADRIVAKWQ